MKIYVVYLVLAVFFFACNTKTKEISSGEKIVSKESSPSVANGTFDSVLEKAIFDYIVEVDNNFINKEWLYYNLYFFNIDSNNYFTMWTFIVYPSYISSCVDTANCIFSLFDFNDRKVVVIDNKLNANPLFSFSEENVSLARKEDLKDYAGDIYDGSFYFRTYQIMENSNGVSLVKLDTAISDFINCEELEIEELEW